MQLRTKGLTDRQTDRQTDKHKYSHHHYQEQIYPVVTPGSASLFLHLSLSLQSITSGIKSVGIKYNTELKCVKEARTQKVNKRGARS